MTASGGAVGVLVAAGGDSWETAALDRLGRTPGLAVQRRCVDLEDLLGAARTGLAAVALVTGRLPGLDADSVDVLGRAGVGLVVVLPEDAVAAEVARLERLGAAGWVPGDLQGLEQVLVAAASPSDPQPPSGPPPSPPLDATPRRAGRVTAVWGPTGAPGRTTVATTLAAELAGRGVSTFLLDADPYGGAVAQHLGVLDEVSGLLAAARAANAGRLDVTALAGMAREVGPSLRVLTGLPRPDRWSEVRPAAFADLLETAAELAERLVVDVGLSLEEGDADPFTAAPRRNGMTLDAVDRADDLVVVGAADPVGLARLARGLVEVAERCPTTPTLVVVNRSRSSLGWSEHEVRGMVEGFHRAARVVFVPDDPATADRALMAGRSVVELGDSPLRRGVGEVADALLGVVRPGRAAGAERARRRAVRPRRGRRS